MPGNVSASYILLEQGDAKSRLVEGVAEEPIKKESVYMIDSQWKGCILLSANQKESQRWRGQVLVCSERTSFHAAIFMRGHHKLFL